MKNKIRTNVLILFLVIFTGISTNMPLVLCFGESGHVRLEIAEMSRIEPFSHHSDSSNQLCDGTPWESDCGDCFDLPVFSYNLIDKKIRNIDNFLLTIPSYASMWTFFQSFQKLLSSGIKDSYKSQANFTINNIIKKVVLLI
jgi:hypothetical protein